MTSVDLMRWEQRCERQRDHTRATNKRCQAAAKLLGMALPDYYRWRNTSICEARECNTLAQVAAAFGVSKERVRQIVAKAECIKTTMEKR